MLPKTRSNSEKLVTSSGIPLNGPYRAAPTNPAVLVLTPSMVFARKLTSSTYTPGARYSGMDELLRYGGGGPPGNHKSHNVGGGGASPPSPPILPGPPPCRGAAGGGPPYTGGAAPLQTLSPSPPRPP